MAWRYELEREDLRSDRIEWNPIFPFKPGAVLQLALTANVVTYALTGGQFGYWKLFPTEPPRIVPPAWGEVRLANGTIAYGLVPMASHAILRLEPAKGGWRETSDERAAVDRGYNRYLPAAGSLREREDALLFRPLVVLGLVLDRWLREENWFGASQIAVTSASSKSALGYALRHGDGPPLLGLTSARNRDFVERTMVYDSVAAHDELPQLAAGTLILDLTGDPSLIRGLSERNGDALRVVRIGATHAGASSLNDDTVFFAPERIGREIALNGLEVFERDRAAAIAEFASRSTDWFIREHVDGPDAIVEAFRDLLTGRVSPERLLIARPEGAFE